MEKNQNANRIEYIDIAKGFAIVLMIIGHTIPNGLLKNIIYSFHMPLFFFLSGFFMKPQSFDQFLKKQATNLLIPYVVTAFVFTVLSTVKALLFSNASEAFNTAKRLTFASFYGSGATMNVNFHVPFIGAIWFLLALFFASIFINFVIRYRWGGMLVLIVAVIGTISVKFVWLPFSIQPATSAAVFIYAGYLCRKYKLIDKWSNPYIDITVLLFWLFGAVFCGHMWIVCNDYESGVLNFIVAFLGIKIALMTARFIDNYSVYLKKQTIYLGQNTLIILCIHLIETYILPWRTLVEWSSKVNQASLFWIIIVVIVIFKIIIAYIGVFVKNRIRVLKLIYR